MIHFDLIPEDWEAVPGLGSGVGAEFVFVGGAPPIAPPKAARHLPMGASSVAMIQKLAGRLDVSWYITNLVKVRYSASRKVPKSVVRKWYPRLLLELKAVKPRRVLAMGIEAAETLCPGFKTMTEDHGTMFWNPELECYVLPTKTFRDAVLDPREKKQLLRDIERLVTLPDPVLARINLFTEPLTLKLPENRRVWLDIETTGLTFEDTITRVGLSWFEKKEEMFIIQNPDDDQLADLRQLLIDRHATVIGHNLEFDLARLGHWTGRPWLLPVEDTLLRAHVAGERGVEDKTGSLSLKHLTSKYTNRPGPHAFGNAFSEGEALDQYLSEDVLSTRDLWKVQEGRFGDKSPYILGILNQLLPGKVAMQLFGVHVDYSRLRELEKVYSVRVSKVTTALAKYGDINWNAPAQLAQLLVEQGVPLRTRTDAGALSVAEAVLLKFKDDYPIIQAILEYREAIKDEQFITSYLGIVTPDHSFLHPRLLLTGTETGRLSCRDPNLQQVPRIGPVKQVFTSRWEGGKIGLVDLAQAELRVIALLSGDELLLEALLSEDVHRAIASRVYKLPPEEITSAQRKKSKGVTFGLMYGGGPTGLAERVGVSVAEVEQVLEAIFNTFTKMNRWIERQHVTAQQTGGSRTLFGRYRDLSRMIHLEGQKSANRKATNTPVQSIASDIDLILLFTVQTLLRTLKLKTRPVLGVHDSLVFDVYPGEERALADAMLESFQALNATPLTSLSLWGKLPMAGELIIGESWAHCESTNEAFSPEKLYPLNSLEDTELITEERARELAIKAKEEKTS